MNVKILRCSTEAHNKIMCSVNVKMTNKGVTLIEMLVAVTIFAIIIAVISGLFISAVYNQRRLLANQELLDQASYILEYMGRALRMAKKDLGYGCLDNIGYNYQLIANGIKFIAHKYEEGTEGTDECTEFFLDAGQLKKKIGADTWELTSSKLQVNSFRINISGESQTDNLQPRVTIFLDISGRELPGRPRIQIQTTVSQRNLDVPL
jgi:prepilin-type N-terminal cleavage/methylation domain-containing protein